MKKIFNSSSEKDTQLLAKDVAKSMDQHNVVCLYGELGAGKTTFVKSFAKALGVQSRIISPTYVLIRTYNTGNNLQLFHIDAYRINVEKDTHEIEEILAQDNAIIVIEWADRISSILPKKRIDIEFINKNNNEREIEITRFL